MKIKACFGVTALLFLFSLLIPSAFLSAQVKKEDPLCGPKSLLAVFKKLGVKTNLEELKKLSDYEEGRGTTMAGLYKAVQAKGLSAVGMKITLDDLSKIKIPVIVFLWGGHFEAIDKFEKERIRTIGPDEEPQWISKTEITNTYSGLALLIAKNKSSFPKIDIKGADIRFDEYVYNFGVIEQFTKRKVEYIFKFKNVGSEELVISKVNSPCSCTAALLSDKNIVPGGMGEIKATVDIEGRKGEQTFAVFVQSNDPVTPIVELQIKGVVQRGLNISPKDINFGDAKEGAVATKKLTILAPEGEELNILKIEPSSKYLSTKISETKEKDNKGFEIEVTLASDVPIGKLEETLTIYTTSEKSPIIEIPVTGNIKGDIELRPNSFFFGSIKIGEIPASKVTIFTTSSEPLKIEKIENPLEEFVSVTIAPKIEGKEYELVASLKGNAPTGTIKGNLTIRTNNSAQPQIEIPVYALIK